MSTVTYQVLPETSEIEVPLRGRNIGNSIEIAFDGDIGSSIITVYRRFYNNNDAVIGSDVPLAYSWTNQAEAQITGAFAGFTLENLRQESSIVFKFSEGGNPTGFLILLGISPA